MHPTPGTLSKPSMPPWCGASSVVLPALHGWSSAGLHLGDFFRAPISNLSLDQDPALSVLHSPGPSLDCCVLQLIEFLLLLSQLQPALCKHVFVLSMGVIYFLRRWPDWLRLMSFFCTEITEQFYSLIL